ncbi:MAG: hypothetical protein J5520_07800 [Bacteroidales bacterium]|nr:hypothetical protein [Bacteroidales bacterium]
MKRTLLITAAIVAFAFISGSCNREDPIVVSVTPEAPVLSADIQDYVIKVSTNSPTWSARLKYGTMKISKLDVEGGTITLTSEFNYGKSEKTDSLTITASDVIKTIPVKQLPLSSILSSSEVYLNGTNPSELKISSVHPWTISYAQGLDWLSVSQTEGLSAASVSLQARSEFIDVGSRTGTIYVKLNGKNVPVYVTQGQKDVVYLSGDDKVYVESVNSELKIGTRTNVSYEVEIGEDAKSWLEYVPRPKALNEYSETFKVANNDSFDERTGTVTFKYGDDIRQTVTVVQRGLDLILKESVPGMYFPTGNTLYKAGTVQMRRSYSGNNVTFSFLYPNEVKAVEFAGLTKNLSVGDKVSLKVTERTEASATSETYDVVVLKAENNFLWLKDGDYKFIVKN